jgi:hypothetical protein
MKHVFGNTVLFVVAASLTLSRPSAAQKSAYTAKDIPPPENEAAHVQITEGLSLELFRNNEAIIRWTSTNAGGSDEHFGFVRYGTGPIQRKLTAKSHIRLNRGHRYAIFRVRVKDLEPGTTYYYSVGSTNADGTA